MHWLFTGLLVAVTVGTVAWSGFLLRRLFVVEPAAEPVHGPTPTTEEEPTA